MHHEDTVVAVRTLHVFAQDVLGGTFLHMVGSNGKKALFLLHHDDISILIDELQHIVSEFVVVLGLADLYLHTGFQGEVVLGGDGIVYQYYPIGE